MIPTVLLFISGKDLHRELLEKRDDPNIKRIKYSSGSSFAEVEYIDGKVYCAMTYEYFEKYTMGRTYRLADGTIYHSGYEMPKWYREEEYE